MDISQLEIVKTGLYSELITKIPTQWGIGPTLILALGITLITAGLVILFNSIGEQLETAAASALGVILLILGIVLTIIGYVIGSANVDFKMASIKSAVDSLKFVESEPTTIDIDHYTKTYLLRDGYPIADIDIDGVTVQLSSSHIASKDVITPSNDPKCTYKVVDLYISDKLQKLLTEVDISLIGMYQITPNIEITGINYSTEDSALSGTLVQTYIPITPITTDMNLEGLIIPTKEDIDICLDDYDIEKILSNESKIEITYNKPTLTTKSKTYNFKKLIKDGYQYSISKITLYVVPSYNNSVQEPVDVKVDVKVDVNTN